LNTARAAEFATVRWSELRPLDYSYYEKPKCCNIVHTVWLVRRASLLVLFPHDHIRGTWGKGSTLAFTTALFNLKPVFVVTDQPPDPVPSYLMAAGSLCDLVPGYWVLPYPEEGGVCNDEW
jgi:hypothetical protein